MTFFRLKRLRITSHIGSIDQLSKTKTWKIDLYVNNCSIFILSIQNSQISNDKPGFNWWLVLDIKFSQPTVISLSYMNKNKFSYLFLKALVALLMVTPDFRTFSLHQHTMKVPSIEYFYAKNCLTESVSRSNLIEKRFPLPLCITPTVNSTGTPLL